MSTALKQAAQALEGTINELESVLLAINSDKIPHDGDEFHERLGAARKALAALAAAPQQEPDKLDAERQTSSFMDRATYATSSGAGYKQISFRFAELEDAEQLRLWAESYGAKGATFYTDAARKAQP